LFCCEGTNPCQERNGNCSGLCIPIPRNASFLANHLLQTVVAEYATSPLCMCGEEYNGTCDKPSTAVDREPPTFDGKCGQSLEFVAPPCSSSVFVNYTVRTLSMIQTDGVCDEKHCFYRQSLFWYSTAKVLLKFFV